MIQGWPAGRGRGTTEGGPTRQSKEDVTTHLVDRLDWRFARRDESRSARRGGKKQAVEALYRREAGAILEAFVRFLDEAGVWARWPTLQGEGSERERLDFCQDVILYGIKTL